MTDNSTLVINETKPDIQADSVMRFLFEEHGVRGEIMHMQHPTSELMKFNEYPDSVHHLMLELAGAAVLIAATLKIDGLVTVQVMGGKGEHALRYAFVNIDKDLNFYGSAGLFEDIDYSGQIPLKDLAGYGGVLVISVLPQDGTRYQGLVALEQESIALALEDYFKNSEQLPTRFKLFHDITKNTVSGIMLQIIPEIKGNLESLEHLATLAESMTEDELTNLSLHECVRRLYWNDKVRVFDPVKIDFKCTCSKERYLETIKNLPLQEVQDLAQDQDGLILTCHNCGCKYHVSHSEMQELLKTKLQAVEDESKTQEHNSKTQDTDSVQATSQAENDAKDCVVLSEQ